MHFQKSILEVHTGRNNLKWLEKTNLTQHKWCRHLGIILAHVVDSFRLNHSLEQPRAEIIKHQHTILIDRMLRAIFFHITLFYKEPWISPDRDFLTQRCTKQLWAPSGATLYMVCRSKDRAEAAREEILTAAAGRLWRKTDGTTARRHGMASLLLYEIIMRYSKNNVNNKSYMELIGITACKYMSTHIEYLGTSRWYCKNRDRSRHDFDHTPRCAMSSMDGKFHVLCHPWRNSCETHVPLSALFDGNFVIYVLYVSYYTMYMLLLYT